MVGPPGDDQHLVGANFSITTSPNGRQNDDDDDRPDHISGGTAEREIRRQVER